MERLLSTADWPVDAQKVYLDGARMILRTQALLETPPAIIETDEDGEGPRTPTMSATRIREDLPELLDAAETLIEKRLTNEDAFRSYFPRLLAAYDGDRSKIFRLDNIHEDYL